MTWDHLLTAFVVCLSPGIGVVYTLSSTLGGGLAVTAAAPLPPGRIVWRGGLLNILDPKLPLFFMAFLPQFLPAGAGAARLDELGLKLATERA